MKLTILALKKEENIINNFIFGKNTILEALKGNREINFIMCCSKIPKEIINLASKKKIPIKHCDNKKINSMFKNFNHQGIIAQISSRKYASLDDITNFARKKNENPFIVILDKIQDPHNFGAIARTAECMGVHGIVVGKRNCASITPASEKCSCGAFEHLLVARVDSLPKTCDWLKKNEIWICGTDADGENLCNLHSLFQDSIALVIGSEGFGISKLVKSKCDVVASIPLHGRINSLNASVAAAIFMSKIAETRRS